jgi:L-malate glycosyltransferase
MTAAGHVVAAPPSSELDIADAAGVPNLLADTAPEAVARLGAGVSATAAARDPEGAVRTNIGGAIALIEAAGALEHRPCVLVTSSADVYGTEHSSGRPLAEDAPVAPRSTRMPPPHRLRLAFVGNPNSVHLRRWLAFFARRGHEVHLLDGFGFDIEPGLENGIETHRYSARGRIRIPLWPSMHSRRVLGRLLQRLRPDVVHGHFVTRYGHQVGLAGYHPYVISAWGSDVLLEAGRSWRSRWLTRLTLRRADLVTAVSNYVRAAAVAAGARPDRIEIVQHGIDLDRFSPGTASAETLRRLGLGERPFILSPRAMRPLYRQEMIIQAFARLPDGFGLVMTARGADPEYRSRLERQAADRGVAHRVQIIDGVSEADLPELYRAARVVVSVPQSDSFPISLLEAMACATPVVAGDLPAVREVLEGVTPESLVPSADVGALTSALGRTLELSESERSAIGSRLRSRVAYADYETNMLRMEELYLRLARGER